MDLVTLFNQIRDIPFRVPESADEELANCWAKHRKLFILLNRAGFKVRYRVCEFLWSEQKLPEEIIKIPHQEQENHLFLELNLNDKWVLLDCTMDSKMPQFNDWDGKSDCRLGVNPKKIFTALESSFLEKQEPFKVEEIINKNKQFFKELNKFYIHLRK